MLQRYCSGGGTPTEDPEALLAETEDCIVQLQGLISRINRTNSETHTPFGTMTELLARRDCLSLKADIYREFLQEASSLSRRATRSEIKLLSTVSVKDYQKKLDALSRELRETDTAIQSANWSTELL